AAFDNIGDRASRKSPLGRRVDPDEIAGAVLFLLSDLSGGVSGQCLNVDVGVSANSPLGTGSEYLETTNLRR
ncbi:MAG: SDR family oxidoreductase, partial [Actinobacteria bacterium]|nr:SDR family oxidoreductase [Actinomycetota bacterium]